ncbi:MAG: hypothetical protein K6F31_06280 [Acetatifactor sp.]|nr:hypothetical protein [Acetatifactor sp.]
MSDINQFQCPCCGARLGYDGEKDQMHCQYCDSTFSVEQIKAEQAAKEEMAAGSSMNWQTSSSSSSVIAGPDGKIEGYSCPACGAQMMADEKTAATECPYCGNFAIIKTSFEGMYKPDLVLPFVVSKEKAQSALTEFTKGKKLLPDAFVNRNRIDSLTGLYVPFWLYSCHADGTIFYEGVKSKKWEDNDYRYVKKDHYRMIRGGAMDFERIPCDASTKMDDATMDSLEPYDLSKAVPYDAAYFSGYLADRYDVEEKDTRPRANERVQNSFRDRLKEEVKEYEEVKATGEQIRLSNAKAEYAMLPVWMMTTQFEGQAYTFGINGQTGQMVGSLPIDKSKATKQYCITGGISLAVALVILRLILGTFGVGTIAGSIIAAVLIALIHVSSLKSAMNTVHKKTTAKAYMSQNSVKLGRREDNFLYSKTEKTEKPKQQQQQPQQAK